MLIYIYLSIFMTLASMMIFSSKRKHLLIMLLSLEMILIAIYLNLMIYLSQMNYDYFFSMIYLTMGVCEGVLGLGILVKMIRSWGNDYILSFSLLW